MSLTCANASALIDDFSSLSSIYDMWFTTDTGTSYSLTGISGTHPGDTALRLNYSLGAGNFVVEVKDYSHSHFASMGGNTVKFRYKATGNSNTLEFKFVDNDSTNSVTSDKLDYKMLTVPDNQWHTVTVALSSFATFCDGNCGFNLDGVTRMGIGFTTDNSARGAGTVLIDKIELYKSTSILVDDFNDGADPNFFGGTNLNNFAANGGSASVLYPGGANAGSLWLHYNVTAAGAFSGLFMNIHRNLMGYTHLSFKVMGGNGGEIIKAKLESPTGSNEVFVSTYLAGGITKSFQEVRIPLSAFPAVDFSNLSVFTVVVTNDIGSGSGDVYFDDLGFVRQGETPGTVKVLDDMDTDPLLTNWVVYTHVDATMNVSAVPDDTAPDATAGNSVYKLDYNFTTNPTLPLATPYAVIERPLYLSIAPYNYLRLRYMGTGASNNIEFKLIDSGDTTWIKRLLLATDTGGKWITANVPLDQFYMFTPGDDSNLDLRNIKRAEFAIVKGNGGSGSFALDALEARGAADFESIDPSKLISAFHLQNNPFSPNGDGNKDQVYVLYTLGVSSKINLRIYNLQGKELRTAAIADQNSGDQRVFWDGKDSEGDVVPNGLYLLRLEAEGFDNRKDVITQPVAVLR